MASPESRIRFEFGLDLSQYPRVGFEFWSDVEPTSKASGGLAEARPPLGWRPPRRVAARGRCRRLLSSSPIRTPGGGIDLRRADLDGLDPVDRHLRRFVFWGADRERRV
jgi:hypothetical protein